MTISQKIQRLGSAFEGFTAAPPKSDLVDLESLAVQVKQLGSEIERLIQQDLADLNRRLIQAGALPIRLAR